MTAIERKQAIQSLIDQYKKELGPIIEVGPRFDPTRLPQQIQDMLRLVVAKSPGFSNIAALGVTNFAIAHVLGQLRPKISDMAYSSNLIGCNVYSVIISSSGSGKSSSVNALLNTFKPALELVENERRKAYIIQARAMALADMQKEDKNITESQVTEADYQKYLPKALNRTIVAASSTRGGISSLVAKLQKEEYSNLSILIDELGLSLKSGNTIEEVLAFLTEAFDMGNNEAPEFKNDDVKEISIEGMYTNMMAHTSPRIIFEYESVKDKLIILLHTAFARRVNLTFPDDDETNENNPIPIGPHAIEESRKLSQMRRHTLAHGAVDVSQRMTTVIEKMLNNPDERLVKFSPDAASLYLDYFDFCVKRSEAMEDSSIMQIEMAGRSFRLGKLAALWALACNSNTISLDIMESIIYYAEYNAKYLEKFVRLTKAQPFELLAEKFQNSDEHIITLDSAVSNGYVSRISKDFRELLDPLNSVLRKDGICTYNDDNKTFIYTPFKKTEEVVETKVVMTDEGEKEVTVTKAAENFGMSYTLIPDNEIRKYIDAPDTLTTEKEKSDWVKAPRLKYLNNFQRYKGSCGFKNLVNLIAKKDSVYSIFRYEDGPDKDGNTVTMNRNQKYITGTTKLIIIDVDKSDVDIYSMHSYLNSYQHIIATSSNKNNKKKFRILLPINIELEANNPKQYSYVTKRIAADLLVKADPVSHVTSHPFYGYADSEVFTQEEGNLYDISEYLGEFASGETEIQSQERIRKERSPRARQAHVDKILDNIDKEFERVINAPFGEGSFRMAWASKHMRDEGFTKSEYEMTLRYLNQCWDHPMPEDRLRNTLLNQFLSQMQEG